MKYTHLTENERYMISALRKQGISTAKIAKQLGRHKATIYREIERNCRYNKFFDRYSYQPRRAQQMARNRLSRSRRNKRYTNGLIRQYLPKRTSMSHVTQKLCNEIAHKLNTRPRKRLGYRIPLEYIHAHL
ncbi:helix-turn-helix domain-containing protein [Vibrio vulnificus]|uniref:helix-turn-helix domain-containing protein n=1 Tax=Vibrio vulnificus TaxID=672 RepID=UPI0009B8E4AC|nr:helix-turn-helix domain-containing protein [Vibrio vulnificus]